MHVWHGPPGRLEIPIELVPSDPEADRQFLAELEAHLAKPHPGASVVAAWKTALAAPGDLACPYCAAAPGAACIGDCPQYPIVVRGSSVWADRATLMEWLLARDGTTPDRLT